MDKSKYIQSIRPIQLTWNDWNELQQANRRKINRLQRVKRVLLWFMVTLALCTLIIALITL